jgi:succinate-acetate transporter protein
MESTHHEIVNMPSPHYKRPAFAHENTMVSDAEKTITPFENTMNPAALCLAGLAIVTMTIGLANTGIVEDFPPTAISSCLTVAFLSNVIAGILELRAGNSKSKYLVY